MEESKMAVKAAMVKELREMTGAGMMDCKKALTATEGDMDAADVIVKTDGRRFEDMYADIVSAVNIGIMED